VWTLKAVSEVLVGWTPKKSKKKKGMGKIEN